MKTKFANNYSQKEINEIKDAIRSGEKFTKIAERFSADYNRSYAGVYIKVCSIAKRTRKIRKPEEIEQATTPNSPMTFTPKKIEISTNGLVTMYF
jgi:hypothetical protein